MESEVQDVILKSHLIRNKHSILVFNHNIWLFFINYICNTAVIICLHKKIKKHFSKCQKTHGGNIRLSMWNDDVKFWWFILRYTFELLKTKHLVAIIHWSSIFGVIDNVICGRSNWSPSTVWILEWTDKWKTASESRLEMKNVICNQM